MDMHEKRFAGDLDRLRSPERVTLLEVERVVDLCMEAGDISSVLDVGTGTALFAKEFARHGLKVAGADVNPETLPLARSFVHLGDFREGPAEALPFPDHSYDLVFLGLVLHEADDPLKALKEAHRVVRKQVCILEWPYTEQPFGPPLAHRLNPEILVGLFHEAGFRKWKTLDLANTVLYCLDV
jgi:ubiquinone/menaquinone biosynthesis C-methylase UbiE